MATTAAPAELLGHPKGPYVAENGPRRHSGFLIFYVGSTSAPCSLPYFVDYVGGNASWSYCSALGGLMMAAGLVTFLVGQPHRLGQAEPAEPALLRERALGGLSREWLIYLGALAGVVAAGRILQTRIDFAPPNALLGGH